MEGRSLKQNKDIQIRDPFIFPVASEQTYYMFGSTDSNIWGKGTGFNVYKGKDLKNWEGPFPAFRPDESFFSEENFWAPEVHEYEGNYYMFATFLGKETRRRGTAILKSSEFMGPYEPHSDGPVTPKEWECLDGTLHVDGAGDPWMIFCHEWVQVGDGEICAIRLSKDLKESIGEPIVLFRASEAPWPTSFEHRRFPERINYVTDGPFLFYNSKNELLMLWSSFIDQVYAQGISRSTTGSVLGPWEHEKEPLYVDDGGHGMIFKTFGGEWTLTLHSPNKTPNERPIFVPLIEIDGKLQRKSIE